MTRTKMLAVVGVVLLVALAGCGGTDPDNVSEPTDGVGEDGAVGGETTAGVGEDGEGTTDGEITTADEEMTDGEGTDGAGTTDGAGAGDETTDGEMTTEEEGTDDAGTEDSGGADASTANVTFEDQSSNGSAVALANVTLPNGGFIAVHNTTADGQVGDVLGNSSYLEAGSHENVTVEFMNTTISEETDLVVMLYEDTNDNQAYDYPSADNPYMADGEPVTANATVTVSENGAGTDGGAGTDDGTGTDDSAETTTS